MAVIPHRTPRKWLVHPKGNVGQIKGVYTIDCGEYEGKYVGNMKRKLKSMGERT